MRLSAGPRLLSRTVASGCALVSAWVVGMLCWFSVRLIWESVTERPIDVWGSLLPHVVVVAVAGLGVYVLGAALLYFVTLVRTGTWLRGEHLGTRLLLRRQWVDLRAADIRVESMPVDDGTKLVVQRPDSSVEVTLKVADRRGSLPAKDLTALAAAIENARGDAADSGDESPAGVATRQLRHLATQASH